MFNENNLKMEIKPRIRSKWEYSKAKYGLKKETYLK